MRAANTELFLHFSRGLIGLPVSHVWTGHGSALFLELGKLTPMKKRDGREANPDGEVTVMIEWSWRIEGRKSIICGSWSEDNDWLRGFALLKDNTIAGAYLFGRLPEIDISLSNDTRCLSFMTEKGHPQWAIIDRRSEVLQTLHSRNGLVELENSKSDRDV